jgi:N utilization substance protein B
MGIREKGREIAVQALYQVSMLGPEVGKEISFDWVKENTSSKVTAFATELLHGVVAHLDTCDAVINRNLTNWKPDRLGHLERAILRLAVYEYLYLLEIPYEVSITEAVSLAKRFCDTDSYKFVNGVLDAVVGNTIRDPGAV